MNKSDATETICKRSLDDVRKTAPREISNRCGFNEINLVEVPCESYQEYDEYETCVMTERTSITSTNFAIADLKDDDVEAIIFDGNRAIEYLPFRIFVQLPEICIYKASQCSIKQVTMENFENLYRLKSIDLSLNQIQKISGNTFKGLKMLQQVNLSKFSFSSLLNRFFIIVYIFFECKKFIADGNQIKSINGRTFDQLPMLTSVDLRSNECIDEKLNEGDLIKNFTRKIIQNCAFTETGEREFEKIFDIECGVGVGGNGFVVGGMEIKRAQW